jgi:hypothetical protein
MWGENNGKKVRQIGANRSQVVHNLYVYSAEAPRGLQRLWNFQADWSALI